jgi:DNA-binding transcriptional regulator YbjK
VAARASAVQRRLDIIAAALRVMARDGLRAISHRAVAAEAQVPLAATTYYFRDLEDLIIESFLHWSEGQRREVEQFHARTLELLDRTAGAAREERVRAVAAAASLYVENQVERERADRVLEYAFLHEAVRVPRLRAAVERQRQDYLRFLEEFHAALGSQQPALDAQITHSVLLGAERAALLAEDAVDVAAVLRRHLLGAPDAASGVP